MPKNAELHVDARHLGWRLTHYYSDIYPNWRLKVAQNKRTLWFSKNASFIIPFIAFLIPTIVRAIPEILMGPYLVGFDTIAYYVPNTLNWLANGVDFWHLVSSAPLIYLMLMTVTSAGASIVFTLKIFAPILLGLLSLAVYYYANKALSWSPNKSLTVALLSTLFFVSLRISWDMFRSELGLIFLFIALICLHKNHLTPKTAIILSLSLLLIAFTHQLVTVIMFFIVLATIVNMLLKNQKVEGLKLVLCSLPAASLFLGILYGNYFLYSVPFTGYSGNFAAGFQSITSYSQLALVTNTLGFLAFCYLPLVPLLIFGVRFKSNLQLKAWLIWLLVPLVLAMVLPNSFFLGGVLPYRWTLLLIFPLAFYAVEGLSRLKWRWYHVGYKLAVGSLLVFLSLGFMVLPNSDALSYYGSYPTYIPKSMLQNTVQLSDCQDVVNALNWAKNNLPQDGNLLVHSAFYGWATLDFDGDRVIPYSYGDPAEAANTTHANNPAPLYLIWWINGTGWYGQTNAPSSFQMLYHSNNIAIYKYLPI
ncbi:MAG: hypothetical protein NWE92_08560 [Candidatus Bathyarchaeota archaeon]|nr:hypothetical protein [Candidatus Bathyarchaeota archaeon]